ncbi:PDZ domain-containing protein [Myxococcota bacterium]|nr:PDZ domain-containing protein [Myxococcota bacterium]MBU1431152.1 PDZ domain-containing protein [Myxococcota bacterium]MBU1897614.1 PDZ domain-containing protein [Myxococcota bacterium]
MLRGLICAACLWALLGCDDEVTPSAQGAITGAPDVITGEPDVIMGEPDVITGEPDVITDTADLGVDVADSAPLPEGFEPALIPLDGQMLLHASLDGAPATLVIDTGAMRTSLEEARLRDVENGVGRVDLALGGYTLPDFAALAADFSEARAYIGPLDGVIGQDLFDRFDFGLDYRRAAARIDEVEIPTPPGFGPLITLPFERVQGLPVVRLGAPTGPAALVADTGSGVTLLMASAAGPLPEARLEGYAWHTRYGTDMCTIAYLPLDVAGHMVMSWVVIIPDDHHLRAIFDALGLNVAGILGYPLFRQFFVHVEGRADRFRLAPDVADPAPPGEWSRVGVELKRSPAGVEIDMVFHPSQATAAGLRVGDLILSVDGEAVSGLTLDEVRARLRGAPGRGVSLRLGDGREVEVVIEQLLSPPL